VQASPDPFQLDLEQDGSANFALHAPARIGNRNPAMNALTKLALGAMGRLRPKPAQGDVVPKITLPAPDTACSIPLMEAIAKRHSSREFAPRELPLPRLSNLLWAANGVNRSDGGRTAPSAMNAQEIDIYVALPSGAYLYDAAANALQLVAGSDIKRVTGYHARACPGHPCFSFGQV
jgi:hypothetical protein